jgi:hypothetical protein
MGIRTVDWQNKVLNDETYVGATLDVFVKEQQIMSDVWGQSLNALVWDAEKGEPRTIHLDTWEYGRDDLGKQATGTPDATDEVVDAYIAYVARQRADRAIDAEKVRVARPGKGAMVKVVKGRQNKGVQGLVVVEIVRPYNMGWKSSAQTKFGIATSDVMVDVAAANGKVYKNYRDVVWAWAFNTERLDVPAVDEVAIRNEEYNRAVREFAKYRRTR